MRGEASVIGRTEGFALVAVGMINVVFLAGAARRLFGEPHRIEIIVSRYLILLLFPFCWVVFHDEELHFLPGFLLWIIGMLLVMFTRRPVAPPKPY
jgi:hypothetical protein